MSPVIDRKSGLKFWARKPKAPTVAWSDDDAQRFYNSPEWRKLRKAYMDSHPLCEVSLSERKHHAGKECDHIIPIRYGGARYDMRNLMSMTVYYHRRKTGMESRRDGPLVEWVETEHGLIPKSREQLFAVIR